MEEVGDLCDIQGEIKFEWKIKNFLRLPKETNKVYKSPEFSAFGISWEIWIFPNGHTSSGSVGWISLYIVSKSITEPISLNFSFQLATVDGKADTDAVYTDTCVFDKPNNGWICLKIISRSKLIKRKSDLLPSGILTVICTLKKENINGEAESAPVDKFTETGDKTAGGVAVDEFTQTEEVGTGVLKLLQQFKEILVNGNVSDVVLKVDGQEFKSHRCVLAARSPVFSAMMTHDTKEKKTGVVDIEDVDSDTFSGFLKYLYTGSEEVITPESVAKLYSAADKYQVDELKKSCLDYMLSNVSVENFCDILNLSLVYVEKDLTDTCCQFFIENSLAIILTSKWISFLKKNPVAGNELHVKLLKNNMKN